MIPTNPLSPPPEKMENPQNVVMRLKEDLKQALAQNNVQPQVLANLGKMALASIKNKTLYPIVIQHAQQSKIIGGDEGQEYDYKLINQLVTNGKLAEMIMQEGGM
jgi:hypothetical protein